MRHHAGHIASGIADAGDVLERSVGIRMISHIPVAIGVLEQDLVIGLQLLQRGSVTKIILAGPPGSGKSTFAAALVEISKRQEGLSMQVVGIDGFHFSMNYMNSKIIGCEFRYLRKLNYTINATKIDPLLAEFMQGRRGNVSQRHYFLPLMNNNQKKWIKIWTKILFTNKKRGECV